MRRRRKDDEATDQWGHPARGSGRARERAAAAQAYIEEGGEVLRGGGAGQRRRARSPEAARTPRRRWRAAAGLPLGRETARGTGLGRLASWAGPVRSEEVFFNREKKKRNRI